MSFRRHEGVAVGTKWACGESLLSATRPLCAYQAVGLKDIRGFYGFCIKVYGRYLRQTQPCFQLIHVFLRLFIALCCSLFKPKHFINRGSKHIETMGLTEENHAKSHLTSTVMNMENGRYEHEHRPLWTWATVDAAWLYAGFRPTTTMLSHKYIHAFTWFSACYLSAYVQQNSAYPPPKKNRSLGLARIIFWSNIKKPSEW